MKCKDCGYWGGSDSKGDRRPCYHVDIYSKRERDITHKDDTCEMQRDKAKEGV
jgi:hypothetical protein